MESWLILLIGALSLGTSLLLAYSAYLSRRLRIQHERRVAVAVDRVINRMVDALDTPDENK